MPRAIWKGAISFGLVYVPVQVYPATQSEHTGFNLLDRRTLDPVGYRQISKRNGKGVERDDIVRGYEYEKGEYVVISDEEIEAASPESTQTVDLLAFVEAAQVSFLYLDTPYWLAPDKRAGKTYALLREALAASGKIGIRIVREAQSAPVRAASAAGAKHRTKLGTKPAAHSPRRAAHDQAGVAEVAGIRITHPERVIDAHSGLRKLDLVQYFESIAPWLLPHLKSRPVALARAPKGVGGELFFQKHASSRLIPHATQHDGLDPGHAPLLTIDSTEALVGAAQMDTIELHTWNALTTSIEKPDRIVFDLDPDPSLAWERMLEAAQLTRELLDALGLRAWCKTSGGKGLHVVVPLTRHAGWDEVKDFARAVASHMAATLPERFSAKMGAQNRKSRIFVDYLRNGRGASTIAAYAPRARPGLGVSVPVGWDELHTLTSGDQWNVTNVRERLEGLRADPWRDYGKTRQRITASMRQQLESK